MLRVKERWEHLSYWITSPFSPSTIPITHIFAAILVFTAYGKIQLFIVCLKWKRPDFPNTVKRKAVTQSRSTVHELLDDSETWGQTNYWNPQTQFLQSAWIAPVCTRDCFSSSLIKLTSFALWDSLYIEFFSLYTMFKHLIYIPPRKEYCRAPASYGRTGAKQGHSPCAPLQHHIYTFFIILST